MRNANVIDAISAKIAARLGEAMGRDVPVVTAAQLDADPDAWLGVLYMAGLSQEALTKLDYQGAYSFSGGAGAPDNVFRALDALGEYIWVSSEPAEAGERAPEEGRAYDRPGEAPISAAESKARDEDWALSQVHPAYLPDAPDGTPRTADRALGADQALSAAWDYNPETNPTLRQVSHQASARFAERFAPAGFTPRGTGPTGAAERRLAGWAALRDLRDPFVVDALAAGLTKSRVQQITGISRSTIDRIPGVSADAS